MKIALKVTVEMTPEQVTAYCDAQAVERAEVREDVTDYVRAALQDAPAFYETRAGVTVKAAS